MARTMALVAEHLPVPGLAPLVIEYVWAPSPGGPLNAACIHGYHEMCNELITNSTDANYGLYTASSYGYVDIVRLMIMRGAINLRSGFCNACREGHMDIVQLMIERGVNDWNHGLYEACNGGHVKIVQLMIRSGAGDLYGGLVYARNKEHTNIVKLLEGMGGRPHPKLNGRALV